MGASLSRKSSYDERMLRPIGQYNVRDSDLRKMRKLIIEGKLAPFFRGEDECNEAAADAKGEDVEECPICFLNYPVLNRSLCCGKGICTECYLQLRISKAARTSKLTTCACPFCKTEQYAVAYRGRRTIEEKQADMIEEQKVHEARIRMREEEEQRYQERIERRRSESLRSSQSEAPQHSERRPFQAFVPDGEAGPPSAGEEATHDDDDGADRAMRADILRSLRAGDAAESDEEASRSPDAGALADHLPQEGFEGLNLGPEFMEQVMLNAAILRSLQETQGPGGEGAGGGGAPGEGGEGADVLGGAGAAEDQSTLINLLTAMNLSVEEAPNADGPSPSPPPAPH